MHNLNIEFIAECVKTLSESNQCISCDKLNTPCVRYPCGHSACEECISVAECCLLCVTPPSKIIHFNDEPLSLRVQHVSDLVSAFQDLFGVDVNRIISISKKLKLEKQLFPECIQAPNKYYNKRKSSNSSSKGKENRKSKLVLPGEEVSNTTDIEMENRNMYVEEWVNNSKNPVSPRKRPRKPFADINVNQNQQEHFTKDPQIKDNRKRKYFEAISNNTDSNNGPQKQNKENIFENKRVKSNYENINRLYEEKSEVHESGIVIDDDVNEIMDSQEEVIDKDKLACLAIVEAEPNVPFYKKGLLHTFGSATEIVNDDKSKSMKNFDKVTKIIENESYIITINVSNCESVPCCSTSLANKCSNFDKPNAPYVKSSQNTREKKEQEKLLNVLTEPSPHKSEDVKDSNNESGYNSKTVFLEESVANIRKSVLIKDSDTDSSLYDIDEEVTRTVKFNRHSSGMVDYGVLASLQPQGLENRSRQGTRRRPSPRSSDSSEKENYNPNRMKRLKQGKNMKCNQILKKRYF